MISSMPSSRHSGPTAARASRCTCRSTSPGPTEADARAGAFAQWRQNVLKSQVTTELAHPEQFEVAASGVTPDDLDGAVRISADPGRHVEWLRHDLDRGFD